MIFNIKVDDEVFAVSSEGYPSFENDLVEITQKESGWNFPFKQQIVVGRITVSEWRFVVPYSKENMQFFVDWNLSKKDVVVNYNRKLIGAFISSVGYYSGSEPDEELGVNETIVVGLKMDNMEVFSEWTTN